LIVPERSGCPGAATVTRIVVPTFSARVANRLRETVPFAPRFVSDLAGQPFAQRTVIVLPGGTCSSRSPSSHVLLRPGVEENVSCGS
jgi:hypothetical protein